MINNQVTANIPWTSTTDEFDELWENNESTTIPDILSTMFSQQLKHMQAYAHINEDAQLPPEKWGSLDDPVTQASLREFASYTVEELYEAINTLKNKPWKQTVRGTDVNKFHEELADCWHFFIELHILAGINPLDVFREYFRKALINEHRQQNAY
jgi:NTP pyrophosphatase (non-canonical NTP hydrolase)